MTAFVDALDLPTCKAGLVKDKWVYACGLEMADASIKGLSADNGRIITFQAAHIEHHTAKNRWDGGAHDPTATLYFTTMDAWCSCGYDSDA